MRELKDNLQEEIDGKIIVDPTMSKRYGDRVFFQHKIDRLNFLLKGTKLDPAVSKIKNKV